MDFLPEGIHVIQMFQPLVTGVFHDGHVAAIAYLPVNPNQLRPGKLMNMIMHTPIIPACFPGQLIDGKRLRLFNYG